MAPDKKNSKKDFKTDTRKTRSTRKTKNGSAIVIDKLNTFKTAVPNVEASTSARWLQGKEEANSIQISRPLIMPLLLRKDNAKLCKCSLRYLNDLDLNDVEVIQKFYKEQNVVPHESTAQVYLDQIKALEKKIEDLQDEFTIQNEYQHLNHQLNALTPLVRARNKKIRLEETHVNNLIDDNCYLLATALKSLSRFSGEKSENLEDWIMNTRILLNKFNISETDKKIVVYA